MQTGKVTLKKHDRSHFAGSHRWSDHLKKRQISPSAYVANREDYEMSEKIRDQSRIK